MEGTKKLVYWVVGLLVFAGVLWKVAGTPAGEPLSSPTPSVQASVTPKPSVSKTPTATSSASPQSYNDALTLYASRRFQFNAYCQATPSSLSLKSGLSIMIDNRSGDARTFAVGGVFFTLPGYGWRIVTPTAASLPATLYVDCGSSRNVGTIVLQ